MSNLLHKAKNTVGTVFERAKEILKERNISPASFQVQFAIYRNYDCKEDKILQVSTWEAKPQNLRSFMETTTAEGGMGNEAIEIGFSYANKENEKAKISQIILIGDAPANEKSEVIEKRALHGENYWSKTKYAEKTYYTYQLENLKQKGIRIHTFYLNAKAKSNFERIAGMTSGRCESLDINSSTGSNCLTDLVTEEILRSVGLESLQNGDELVNAYRKKYSKSYL